MVWQWTPYTLLFAVTAAALLGFAAYLFSVDRGEWLSDVFFGGLLLLAGGSWVAVYTLKLSVMTLPAKVLLTHVEFVVVLALPLVWFAYVLRYVGRTDWLSWRVFGPLVAIAAAIEIAVLTNGGHRLVYREYALSQAGSFVVFDPVYGPMFAVFLGFVYTLLGVSLLFLATAAPHARGVFRWQIAILFLFALVPGVAGLLFVSGVRPIPGLNIAALSIVVTAVGGAVSYVRFKWLNITPIARDQAFESMTEAVVVLDGERRIIDINPPAEDFLDRSTEALIGTPVADFFPNLVDLFDNIPHDDSGEPVVQTEVERTTADGKRWIDVRASPISAGVGAATGYTLLLHDITVQKEAEQRAKEHRQKMEDLHWVARDLTAAQTREAVFQRAVDGAGEVLDADACRTAVADAGKLVPVASSDDTPAAAYDPQPADAGIAGLTYQSGGTIVIDDLGEAQSAAASGSEQFIRDGDGIGPAPNESHRSLVSAPVGDLGTIQALSTEPGAFGDADREALELLATHIETAAERAAAESELRTERDRLEEFASVVSHDLRNPLSVAQGRIELLREDAPAEHVDPIDRSLSRMEDIITDILTLAREGDTVGDPDTVGLRGCVEDAWNTVDTGAATLRFNDDDLGTLSADPSRLQQLLENLIRNSVEHGSTGPRSQTHEDSVEHGSTGSRSSSHGNSVEHSSTGNRAEPGDSIEHGSTESGSQESADSDVTVHVGLLDDDPGFYVADDGPGIPAGERESIFEHGYTTESGGTGLGLTIVDHIADAHGWTVTATDATTGGARFEIRTDS